MEDMKKRLKVYCATTFWSCLNGRPTPLKMLNEIAIQQMRIL